MLPHAGNMSAGNVTTGDASAPLPPYAKRLGADLELRLKVVPGASRAALAGALGDRLKVRVAEPPEGGKANRAVLDLLSEWFRGASVELVSGHGTPLKTVRVRDCGALPTTSDR
jgi:uncharacterized protein (TIGR00251 family)